MSDEPSNTTQEQRPKMEGGITGKGFVKGDKRINRNGRPKSFDKLRHLAQQIGHEKIADGSTMTAIEAILRQMAHDNPARFVEIGWGKVPDIEEHSGKVEIVVTYRDKSADITSGAAGNQE